MTEYRVIRSDRRTIGLEISRDLQVTVRAPLFLTSREIARFVAGKAGWIERHTQRLRALPPQSAPSADELRGLIKRAHAVLPGKVERYAGLMGLLPTRITITRAKTRYGSCSAKNAISFSCLLMQKDDALIDYVVVHELAHIRHKNHGPEFHSLIEQILPGHRALEKRLRGR